MSRSQISISIEVFYQKCTSKTHLSVGSNPWYAILVIPPIHTELMWLRLKYTELKKYWTDLFLLKPIRWAVF